MLYTWHTERRAITVIKHIHLLVRITCVDHVAMSSVGGKVTATLTRENLRYLG